MWIQDATGNWVGEDCPVDPNAGEEFNPFEAFQGVTAVGEQYQQTITNVFKAACDPNDVACNDAGEVLPSVLAGETPDENPDIAAAISTTADFGANVVTAVATPIADVILGNDALTDVFTALIEESAPSIGIDESTSGAVTGSIDSADSTQDAISAVNSAVDPSTFLD